jgi:hypothetical protein
LLVRSEEFDQSPWTPVNATVTADATTSPNGTVTADLISDNGSTPARVRQQVSVSAGQTYTASIYLKAGSQDSVFWREDNEDSFGLGVNLTTGELISGSGNIEPAGNGWYRISFSGSVSSTSFWPEVRLTSPGTVYAWGAQLEVGSAVTPYIQSPSVFTSRASSGTYVGGNGLIQTAVTNLLLRSEEFDDASWGKFQSTITADTVIAPDGTLTADKLVENTATTTHILTDDSAATAGATYTFSVFFKAAERTFAQLRCGATSQFSAIINLSTGEVTSVVGSTTSSVISVGNGWWRFSISFAADTTPLSVRIGVAINSTTTNYTGDGTSGIYLWGAQLEQASTVGEYIPTTSTINSAARYDHDPISLIGKGLLLEEARTNLALRSEEFDNASWIKTNSTVTADGAISPDGTMDAYKIVSNSALLGFIVQSVSQTTATSYTWSVFAKAGEYSFCQLRITGTVVPSITRAYFNLATGTTTTTTNCTASITAFGNGWYKCSITYTTTSAATASPRFYGQVDDADTVSDGTSGIYIWGAQMEAGAFPPPTSQPPPQQSRELRILALASPPACLKAPGIGRMRGRCLRTFCAPTLATFQTSPISTISMTGRRIIAFHYLVLKTNNSLDP